MAPESPLTLPWTTLRLAVRFFVPLALWYTVGELVKWALSYASFEIGLKNDVVPLIVLGFIVLVTLAVTVAMLHSLRKGLPALQANSVDESVAPWMAREEETLVDAMSRCLFPFLIFYLAWGILVEEARSFAQGAASRGVAEGGVEGATQGLGQTIAIEKHLGVAIALTAIFFVLKTVTERVLLPRYPRGSGILVAVFEINWTLFALFTVVQGFKNMFGWIKGRVLWGATIGQVPDVPVLGDALGWLFGDLWPTFKDAILLTLVWLIIAGVVLGVHLTDESGLLARSQRLSRAHARFQRMRVGPRNFLEELSQEFVREKWVPVANGWRLIRNAGVLVFAVICVLYTSLTLFDEVARRAVYVLVGAETIGWWAPRAPLVGFGVGLIAEILRICLLAAAFDLIVRRLAARGGMVSPQGTPSPGGPPQSGPGHAVPAPAGQVPGAPAQGGPMPAVPAHGGPMQGGSMYGAPAPAGPPPARYPPNGLPYGGPVPGPGGPGTAPGNPGNPG